MLLNESTGQEPIIHIHCIHRMFYLSNLKTIIFYGRSVI